MYFVELTTGNVTHVLHDPYSERELVYKGELTLVENAISDFQFSILQDHPLFADGRQVIRPLETRVTVRSVHGEQGILFRGRIVDEAEKMESNGLLLREYVAECELSYLLDSIQAEQELVPARQPWHRRWEVWTRRERETPEAFLRMLLDHHNRTEMGAQKHIQIGTVTVRGENTNFSVEYGSTFANVKEQLLERLGGALVLDYTTQPPRLHYLSTSENNAPIETMPIELARNLKSIETKRHMSQAVTHLIPLGGYVKTMDLDNPNVAIQRLVDVGLLDTPDFWVEEVRIQRLSRWTGQLMINLARRNSVESPDFSGIHTHGNHNPSEEEIAAYHQAVNSLSNSGAINSPQYWKEMERMSDPHVRWLMRKAERAIDHDNPDFIVPMVRLRLPEGAIAVSGGSIGRIEHVEIWDDITNLAQLRAKALQWLRNRTVSDSVAVNAVDLSYTENYTGFRVGRRYRAKNRLLGIDQVYRLIGQKINILDPRENSLTFQNRQIRLGDHMRR